MASAVAPEDAPRRPHGVDDATVAAHGKLSEALEYVHRVRGALYDVHQLIGRADLLFGEAADDLAAAGHEELAAEVRERIVGRDVLAGRWTFQIVEDFDDNYYAAAVETERRSRGVLLQGQRHVLESELKQQRRTDAGPRDPRR
ncbi:MAG TPA: hypothetical protein VG899_14580 [Mycobacteriales bacterium]|nr:hypothetical protein [Mycobacteriales bacterium]